MSTATDTKATYRKTKAGEWVAYVPAASITGRLGLTAEQAIKMGVLDITVTKKDGTTKVETVARLGKPFMVDGVEMVYAYLAPKARTYASTPDCGHHHPVAGCNLCTHDIGL